MSTPLAAYADSCFASVFQGSSDIYTGGYYLKYAANQSTWANARSYLTQAGNALESAYDHFSIGDSSIQYSLYYALYWINNNWGVGITMLDLIAQMSIATPDEIMTFICLEDAYRAALWDRPYNPEYFATMVRAFKSWQ